MRERGRAASSWSAAASSGSEDILGDGRPHPRQHARGRAGRSAVALARAGLDFLSVSRGGKFEDAQQPPVGEAMYPYTGHSGSVCIPRAQGRPVRRQRAPRHGHPRRGARRRLHDAGGRRRARSTPSSRRRRILREERADLVGMARALLADPDLPRKWLAGADARRARVRLLPLLRGRGPAPPHGDVHALAEGPRQPSPAGDPRSRGPAGGDP